MRRGNTLTTIVCPGAPLPFSLTELLAVMNLSHVITEFSFGPYFPEITQPLDNSFELAHDRKLSVQIGLLPGLTATHEAFMAYQYYLHVVPTTYIAPRSAPLYTAQYSVTHYTRVLNSHHGTPGIFFKFDLEPLALQIHQRTTTLVQLMIRFVRVQLPSKCCLTGETGASASSAASLCAWGTRCALRIAQSRL